MRKLSQADNLIYHSLLARVAGVGVSAFVWVDLLVCCANEFLSLMSARVGCLPHVIPDSDWRESMVVSSANMTI